MKEIETKLTDFDERKVKNTLEEKAIKVSDRIQKRWVFNINNGKDKKDAEWIRLSAMTITEEIILRQARLGYMNALALNQSW